MSPTLEVLRPEVAGPEMFGPDTNPAEIIRWALEQHPDLTMPSAFNLNGVVLLDLAAQAGYTGDVLFVDTGYHFSETFATISLVARAKASLPPGACVTRRFGRQRGCAPAPASRRTMRRHRLAWRKVQAAARR